MKANKSEVIEVLNALTGQIEKVEKVYKTKEEWKKSLTPQQFHITREAGTERPFTSNLLEIKEKGVFTCVGCGNHLFHSDKKFESGTGWPSYWDPVSPKNIEATEDNSLFMRRIEIKCSRCGAHLGHVFDDGPPPSGQRYCINGEALKFLKSKEQEE